VQPADLVRPPRDRNPAPLGQQRGVVYFLFRLLAYPICELKCLGEVAEAEAPFQLLCAITFDDLPFGNSWL
jgi:hypothetical protein